MSRKILLGASYSVIRPLCLLHLSAVAKSEGYETRIFLSERNDLKDLDAPIDGFGPDFLGFTLYTGNHVRALKLL